MDNPKKKKLDAKRISKQTWEIDYMRKIANEVINSKGKLISYNNKFEDGVLKVELGYININKIESEIFPKVNTLAMLYSSKKIIRLAKAYLELTENRKKKS